MLTLKDKFKIKKMQEGVARIERADASKKTKLMLEALDAAEYEKITNSIMKMREIGKAARQNGLKNLQSSIEKAVVDVQKFQAKDESKSKSEKIKSLLSRSKPQDSPLIKSLALVGCLENAFSFLPKILQNTLSTDIEKLKKNLYQE
jgi:hypothetical protein